MWECINFKEEMGVKLIYWLIDHNRSIFFITHLRHAETSFYCAVGVFPPKYLSFKFVFTISDSTSLKYHMNFSLKLSMQHSEKMTPSSLSWVWQYLYFSHNIKPLIVLTYFKGVLAYGCDTTLFRSPSSRLFYDNRLDGDRKSVV